MLYADTKNFICAEKSASLRKIEDLVHGIAASLTLRSKFFWTHIYIYIYICFYMYIYIFIYIYIHIYIYREDVLLYSVVSSASSQAEAGQSQRIPRRIVDTFESSGPNPTCQIARRSGLQLRPTDLEDRCMAGGLGEGRNACETVPPSMRRGTPCH